MLPLGSRKGWYEIPATSEHSTYWRYWDGYGWTSDIETVRPPDVVAPEAALARAARADAALRSPDELASWGYRVGGFVVDSGAAVAVALAAGLALDAGGAPVATRDTIIGIAVVAAWLAVTAVTSQFTAGQSLGKWIGGMRVIKNGSGSPVGFGWSFVRDTVCRLIYLVPLVWLIDSLFPLGERRESLRDKMVGTRVERTASYPRRAGVLAVAALASLALWVGGAYALNASEDYSSADRETFIANCASEGVSELQCACMYEYIAERVSYDDYREADATDDEDAWPRSVRSAMNDAVDVCI